MECWGVEFLDDGDYGKTTPIPKEPWHKYEDAFLLPIKYVRSIADKRYLHEMVNTHRSYIDALIRDISQNGLMEPITLMLTSSMMLFLYDGNHRFLAFDHMYGDAGQVPVRIEIVQTKGPSAGMQLKPFMGEFIEQIAKKF